MPNELHRQILHEGRHNPQVFKQLEPILPEKTGKLEGIRTNAWDGKEVAVELEYELKEGSSSTMYVYLIGGPTGFESAAVGQLLNDMVNATYCSECWGRGCPDNDCENHQVPFEGWTACAGTPKRWDKLFITKASILRELL